MMTKDEALKMAIEALEEAREQIGGLPALDKLIQDCKEALKPHPDCDEACMYQCEHERKHKALEQPDNNVMYNQSTVQYTNGLKDKTSERDYNFMRDLAVGSEELLNKTTEELNDIKELLAKRNLELLEAQNKLLKLAELAGFILTDDKTGIDWASNYDDCLFKFAKLVKAIDKDYVLVCEKCAKELNILE
jgi:hypothetical protein